MAESRLKTLPPINKVFVDREIPQKIFEDAVFTSSKEGSRLLVFYGVGGQGKTWLCKELYRKMQRDGGDPSYAHTRAALLQGRPVDTAEGLLIWIRNEFALAGISTPAFDLALALLWQRWRPEQRLPSLERPWLAQSTAVGKAGIDGLAEKAKEAFGFDAITELIGDFAKYIPGIGPVIKLIGNWAIEKGKRFYLEITRPQLAELLMAVN